MQEPSLLGLKKDSVKRMSTARTSGGLQNGFFSIVNRNTSAVIREWPFAARSSSTNNGYSQLEIMWESVPGVASDMRIGFWGNGSDQWFQIDDFEQGCS